MAVLETTNLTGAMNLIEKRLKEGDYFENKYPVMYGTTNDDGSDGMEPKVYRVKEASADIDNTKQAKEVNQLIETLDKEHEEVKIQRDFKSVDGKSIYFSIDAKIKDYIFENGLDKNGKKRYSALPMLSLPKMGTEDLLKLGEEIVTFAEGALNTIKVMLMADKELGNVKSVITGLPLYRCIANVSNGLTPEQLQQISQLDKTLLENFNNSNIDFNVMKTEQLVLDRIMMMSLNHMKQQLKQLGKYLKDTNLTKLVPYVENANAEAIIINQKTNVSKLTSTTSDSEVSKDGMSYRGFY